MIRALGLAGTVDVLTTPDHTGAAIPKRAAGELSDGRSLVALFGPFRMIDGAAYAEFAPSTAPEGEL